MYKVTRPLLQVKFSEMFYFNGGSFGTCVLQARPLNGGGGEASMTSPLTHSNPGLLPSHQAMLLNHEAIQVSQFPVRRERKRIVTNKDPSVTIISRFTPLPYLDINLPYASAPRSVALAGSERHV